MGGVWVFWAIMNQVRYHTHLGGEGRGGVTQRYPTPSLSVVGALRLSRSLSFFAHLCQYCTSSLFIHEGEVMALAEIRSALEYHRLRPAFLLKLFRRHKSVTALIYVTGKKRL